MKYSLGLARYSAACDQTGLDLTGVGLQDIVKKIGSQLGEVESSFDYGGLYERAAVVRVVDCRPHPNADKLSICKIDDGGVTQGVERNDDGSVTVVCGAPNISKDLLVAWLPPGSTVPLSAIEGQPFVLSPKDLRGVISQGMIASEAELAISDNHDGVMVIDSDLDKASVGDSLVKVFNLDDQIIEIENKMFTHRPDCFGNLGIDRELAGILGQKFSSPSWYTSGSEPASVDSDMDLEGFNQAPDMVPRLTFSLIDRIEVGKSPIWLRAQLYRLGIKPINNLVDYSNYLMHLTAQPTHAFDYDKVAKLCQDGNVTLGARYAKKGEKLQLLGGKEIELAEDDLVIATDSVPVALAGIMGGAATEVDEGTSRVILECATFDMYSIRRSSMRHGLFTDAATRYTKGQSTLLNTQVALKYAGEFGFVKLIDVEPKQTKQPLPVSLNPNLINQRLGSDLGVDDIKSLLENVEFAVDVDGRDLRVIPPIWRTDIEIPEDVVEEVGRMVGYDNLPLQLPLRNSNPTKSDTMLEQKKRLRQILADLGASEVLTYSFVDGQLFSKVGQEADNSFTITNALSPALEYYRQSLTPSLLYSVFSNLRSGNDSFAIFELGRVHQKNDVDQDGLPNESNRLSLVIVNQKQQTQPTYFAAKRYLELMAGKMSWGLDFSSAVDKIMPESMTSAYDPQRSAAVMNGQGQIIGIVGEYKSSVRSQLKLPPHTAGFELIIDAVAEVGNDTKYRPLSEYPSVKKAITVAAPAEVKHQDVLRALMETSNSQDKIDIELSPDSIFSKDGLRHHSFLISISSKLKTLTSQEAQQVIDSLVESINRQHWTVV